MLYLRFIMFRVYLYEFLCPLAIVDLVLSLYPVLPHHAAEHVLVHTLHFKKNMTRWLLWNPIYRYNCVIFFRFKILFWYSYLEFSSQILTQMISDLKKITN